MRTILNIIIGGKILNENRHLSVILNDLSNSIIDEVVSAKQNEMLEISKEAYVKHKITNFGYDKGITGFSTTQELLNKEKWRLKDELEFEKKIENFKSFQEAIEKSIKIYNLEETKARSLIINYVGQITNVCLDEIDPDKVIELTSLFISDLEENPILWQPEVWIDGIWLETNSVKIQDNIILRKPEPADLEFESIYGGYYPQDLHNRPSAILELELRDKYAVQIQKKIESLIFTLRLFKLGSVQNLRSRLNPNSISRSFGGTLSTLNLINAHYKYGLTEADAEDLTKFVNRIEPLIYSEIVDKSADEVDYISIAYDRFCDALLKSVVPENRLATAIMALEALYLKEKELSELTERLSQRVALVLEIFGYDTLEVYNFVKRAYGIRNRFVHGSKVEQKEIGELPEKILDYCRISIIMFLQIHNEQDKDKTINLLSNSLLSDIEKKKLHELINKKCII